MALGGRKGKLVAVIGYGMDRLDTAKLASNIREFGTRYDAFLSKNR